MIRNKLVYATFLLVAATQTQAAAPLVVVYPGTPAAPGTATCTIAPNPATPTLFTLDPTGTGNVFVFGTPGSGCNGSGGSPQTPSFSPLAPAPANLSVDASSLTSAGGPVVPKFVVYYATSCTGSVTIDPTTPTCAAAPTWSNVCASGSNSTGTYCQASTTSVAMPANALQTICKYDFLANCVNGALSASTQTVVSVPANGSSGSGCIGNDTSTTDLVGFSRACSGFLANDGGPVGTWTDYASVFGAYPGITSHTGKTWVFSINAFQFAALPFNSGSGTTGFKVYVNPTYTNGGALASVSTQPGVFFDGATCGRGANVQASTKPGTTGCQLAPNTNYYLNIAAAGYFDGSSQCTQGACAQGWTFQLFVN